MKRSKDSEGPEREDHASVKVMVGDFNGATSLPLRVKGKTLLLTTSVENTIGSSKIIRIVLGKQKSLQVAKGRLSSATLGLKASVESLELQAIISKRPNLLSYARKR
uniref:ASH domain-containing protein n=1 Tax=Haemonchus contortus TaxID=6289 RepID=A0A7I4YPF3_HAECO